MGEFGSTMKRPSFWSIDIGGEEHNSKGLGREYLILNNRRKLPKLEKELLTQLLKANQAPNRQDQRRYSQCCIIDNTLTIENFLKVLKSEREKGQVTKLPVTKLGLSE